MPRSLVELRGADSSFAILEQWLHSPDLELVRLDGSTYLTSSDFVGMSLDEVDQHAAFLLEATNGAIRVEDISYQPVEIGDVSIREDDLTGRRDVVIRPHSAAMTIQAFPVTVLVDGRPVVSPRQSRVLDRIRLAQRDQTVERVLRLMEVPRLDFVDMHNIVELVADSVGGEKNLFGPPRKWTSQRKYRRFMQTANSHGGASCPR